MSNKKTNLGNDSSLICVYKRNPPKELFSLLCDNCDGFGNIFPDYENKGKCEKYFPVKEQREKSNPDPPPKRDELLYP